MQKGYFTGLGPYQFQMLRSYPLTPAQFAYLKPALPEQVNRRALAAGDEFYCISTPQGWRDDIGPRLRGLDD